MAGRASSKELEFIKVQKLYSSAYISGLLLKKKKISG